MRASSLQAARRKRPARGERRRRRHRPETQARLGLGLHHIQARARKLRGKASFDAMPGRRHARRRRVPAAGTSVTIRLLLVDDHEVVRAGLRALLAGIEGMEIVGEAGTVAEAVSEAARLAPEVILMDLRLPDGTGIDACREILSSAPRTRILFVTSYSDEQAVMSTVLAGARLRAEGHRSPRARRRDPRRRRRARRSWTRASPIRWSGACPGPKRFRRRSSACSRWWSKARPTRKSPLRSD